MGLCGCFGPSKGDIYAHSNTGASTVVNKASNSLENAVAASKVNTPVALVSSHELPTATATLQARSAVPEVQQEQQATASHNVNVDVDPSRAGPSSAPNSNATVFNKNTTMVSGLDLHSSGASDSGSSDTGPPGPHEAAVDASPHAKEAHAAAASRGHAGIGVRGVGRQRAEDLLLLPLEQAMMARPSSLQLNKLNNEVKGLRKIGQGAGGVVYRGLWTGVPVAIKFMLSEDPDKLNQTAREAILSRFVSHPNVVQTFTYDVTLLAESAFKASFSRAQAPGQETIGEEGDSESSPSHAQTQQQLQQQQQQQRNTIASLGIFDMGSRSTADFRGSLMPDTQSEFGDEAGTLSLYGQQGWDMQDVLLRLGAQPGQYLTHIIMELCDAGTLQQAILRQCFTGNKNGSAARSKCRAMLRTAREIARGMQHLHALGIIHGDLKPGNVLLRQSTADRRGFVAKVGDFGLAQRCAPDKAGVETGSPLGTLVYAAPESLRGTLHKGSDVFSFGVVVWQMCSGESQPFRNLHAAHIIYGKQNGSLKLEWSPDVYSPVRKLAELCMEQDPLARPSFEQVGKALQQIEQRLQKHSRPPHAAAAAHQQQHGAAAARAAQQPAGMMLMPDPELLP